jgi:3-hydroxyisobutyrate dehydrogenase-like beta-hydroxyacid dehydrogenase
VTVVGLLFPGEMGAEVGAAARAEVVWASEGRSAATRARAEAAGLRDVGSLAELVATSEIVLSVCPPALAEDVAGAVAAAGFEGLFVEANAVSPARAERIAAMLESAGARTVDGGIIGGTGLHLYLSGDRADSGRVAALFDGTAVDAIVLDAGIGAASALKMAFGGWNKIGIALVAQAYAIARAYGVEDALATEGVPAERIARAAPKAWRWAPEMDEVAETCGRLGLPDRTARGAADLYRRWSHHRDRPAELATLLDELLGRPKGQ